MHISKSVHFVLLGFKLESTVNQEVWGFIFNTMWTKDSWCQCSLLCQFELSDTLVTDYKKTKAKYFLCLFESHFLFFFYSVGQKNIPMITREQERRVQYVYMFCRIRCSSGTWVQHSPFTIPRHHN